MNNDYESLRNDFKRFLKRFRWRLLGFNLLKYCIIVLLYFLFYLSFYYVLGHSFIPGVIFKTFLYVFFCTGFIFITAVWLFRPLWSFFLSGNLRKDVIFRNFLKYADTVPDIFVSLYCLAFRFSSVSGDSELKKAAFVQKYRNFAEGKNRVYNSFRKKFIRRAGAGVILVFVWVLAGGFLFRTYTEMADYRQVTVPVSDIVFRILNPSLEVEYGKPFQLRMGIEGEDFVNGHVFVCFGGGEFLMNKKDTCFVYDFSAVNNNIRFSFRTAGKESSFYEIRVLPTPEITDYRVTCVPPAYTGLKTEIMKNTTDFRTVYGSVLRFELGFSSLDSLFLERNGKSVLLNTEEKDRTSFSRKVTESGEYVLRGSNAYFARRNLMSFHVTCIPDLYPGIQVMEMQDSLRKSVFYFYGVITDDYGFSGLRFNYSTGGEYFTVMPVNILKNTTTQEFYFEFDFAQFAGTDESRIRYYFEVFDNDEISGPKSTRSDAQEYVVPDLNTVFEYNTDVSARLTTALSEAEKLAKDIVSDVREMQKKMLDNTVGNWEKQQMAKDIVEKKEKLQKLLEQVQEDNIKKNALNNTFARQDSLLAAKQEKIRELFDKIMDEDMKKLVAEFSKLSEEFSKEKFKELDEKLKLSFDQMSEELDRNIELLKRYQLEEQHGLLNQQLQQLRQQQQQLESMIKERKTAPDSLQSKSQNLKNKLEHIKNNYNRILEDNKQLDRPFDLKNLDKNFEELSQLIDKQNHNIQNKNNDSKLSEEIEDKINELTEEIKKQQQENFMKISVSENDIELIIQNILVISLSQEELMKQFSGVPAQSARYIELGRLQELKKSEYKIVKDSLSLLAKNNLMLASLLSDKFYDIEIKFGLLPDYIQNGKRNALLTDQQFIVSYLNDMALSLSEALQKSRSEEKGSGKEGAEQKGKKGNGKGKGSGQEDYGGLKKMQQGLKQQLENLISQMKKGEKGKLLQQGIGKMIRENELFRKSLNDFMSGSGALSPSEKQLLNEIQKLLEDNIRDLSNYSVTDNLKYRNNQIYNKLLLSEKASKEREEYEERRKSVTAAETKYKRPESYFKPEKRTVLMRSDLKKADLLLNPFYKNMYNNYYIKLGDE